MRRYGVAAGFLALALAACTTEERSGSEPRPATTAPSSTTPAPEGRAEPRTRQPVVLVTHATTVPLDLTERQARRVLRTGLSGRPVLAAPDLPTGPDVPVAESARAVVGMVERRPELVGIVPAAAAGPTVRAAQVGGIDPFRQPGGYPLTVAGRSPPKATTLTVVGDVMLTRGVTDPAGALRPLSPLLRSADVTVGNLESTLSTEGEPQQGSDSFGAGPELLGPLEQAGFDALSLANNHAGDFGEPALVETVRLLGTSRIQPFGAGEDLTEASRPAVVERHNVRFGFLGFNAIGETPMAGPGQPGALSVRMPPRTGPLQEADLRHVTGLIEKLADRVDVVVVLPHWGTQYTHTPEPVQRTVARRLVDAGAGLVVGGHPHWVQGLEVHDGVVIAHSLGNFVFDMDFMTETQQGVVLEATYWGDDLKALTLVPYRMDADFAPRPAAPDEAAEILRDVWSTSTGPFASR